MSLPYSFDIVLYHKNSFRPLFRIHPIVTWEIFYDGLYLANLVSKALILICCSSTFNFCSSIFRNKISVAHTFTAYIIFGHARSSTLLPYKNILSASNTLSILIQYSHTSNILCLRISLIRI